MGFKMPKGIDKVPMTIRVNEKNFDFIKKVSKDNNCSYNEVVCAMIDYAIESTKKKEA